MIFVPIAKPVGGLCNLNCSYCYFKKKEGGKELNHKMNSLVLNSFIDQTCFNQEIVEIIWHGGEPLCAGISFYEKAIEVESKWVSKGKKVFNSIQTNATLVDEKWIDFFKANNFSVGTSMDGNQILHNQTRKFKNGTESFSKVLANSRILREVDLLSNVICCVSTANYKFPKEILDFFMDEGIYNLKFLQVQGRDAEGKLLPYSIDSEKYADFLISVFDYWLELDDPRIKIREIQSIVNLMMGGNQRECMFSGECFKYFTIYPDGSVYGCDSLPKIEALSFGNIENGTASIESSSNFLKFRNRLEELKRKCSGCEWFHLCRGGCLQDWWPDIFHPQTKNLFCSGLKKIFSAFQQRLKSYGLI